MKLSNVFSSNHRILYFPMISMRSHKDDLYDLSSDGNVNRFVANILNFVKAGNKFDCTIVIPSKNDGTIEGQQMIEKFQHYAESNVKIIEYEEFPKGGTSVERSLKGGKLLCKLFNKLVYGESYDYVIYEGNYFGVAIEQLKHSDSKNFNFSSVYWCPVSNTKITKPYFLQKFAEVDKELVKFADLVVVATESQKEYFSEYTDANRIEVNSMLSDPSLEIFSFEENIALVNSIKEHAKNKSVIYFPFRLTDKGYHIEYVLKLLSDIDKDFLFVYTDPNNSGYIETKKNEFKNIEFMKVSTDRSDYYSILKFVDCVIPYTECDDILHASKAELEYFNCKMIKSLTFDEKQDLEFIKNLF